MSRRRRRLKSMLKRRSKRRGGLKKFARRRSKLVPKGLRRRMKKRIQKRRASGGGGRRFKRLRKIAKRRAKLMPKGLRRRIAKMRAKRKLRNVKLNRVVRAEAIKKLPEEVKGRLKAEIQEKGKLSPETKKVIRQRLSPVENKIRKDAKITKEKIKPKYKLRFSLKNRINKYRRKLGIIK